MQSYVAFVAGIMCALEANLAQAGHWPSVCSENSRNQRTVGVGIGIGVAIGIDIEQHRDDFDCDSDPDSDADPERITLKTEFHASPGVPQRMKNCFETKNLPRITRIQTEKPLSKKPRV